MDKRYNTSSIKIQLTFLLVAFFLLSGCNYNQSSEFSNTNSPTTVGVQETEQSSVTDNEKTVTKIETDETSQTDYSIQNDVKDYAKGMKFPIVNCIVKDISYEDLKPYLDMTYEKQSEYRKIEDSETIGYTSIERDGKGIDVMSNSAVRMKLLYIECNSEIENFFGPSLDYANAIISELGYNKKVRLLLVNGIPTSYDNFTQMSDEPIYEIEYVFSPQSNDLYFSCQSGGNNISIQCNNECAFKVIDSLTTDFENISEVTINYAYKESIEIIEGYGRNKNDILYCIFVYSNVFSNNRTEYKPVWEFGFKDTIIQVDATNGEIYDYCPPR